MKTVKQLLATTALCALCATGAWGQNTLKVKVTNIPEATGKILIATDKGQYNIVEATGSEVMLELKDVPQGQVEIYAYHDANGNFQLDKKDYVPTEYCAIARVEVTKQEQAVEVRLANKQKGKH